MWTKRCNRWMQLLIIAVVFKRIQNWNVCRTPEVKISSTLSENQRIIHGLIIKRGWHFYKLIALSLRIRRNVLSISALKVYYIEIIINKSVSIYLCHVLLNFRFWFDTGSVRLLELWNLTNLEQSLIEPLFELSFEFEVSFKRIFTLRIQSLNLNESCKS